VALRKGIGSPKLVRWVRRAYEQLADGVNAAVPERYAADITRMLAAALASNPAPEIRSNRHAAETVLAF
jgi:hypothetical protein